MAPPPGTGRASRSPDAVTDQLIEAWGLMPHPEGGWYREMHRSKQPVTRADGQQRAALTTILFLLDRQSVSRWHRVRHADEVWIHLQGAPLTLWELPPEGGSPSHRILSLQHPIDVIPAEGQCGNENPREQAIDDEPEGEVEWNGLLAGGIERAELAIDADFEYFQDYGSVGAVVDRVSLVTNTMNPQYEVQTGITHCISLLQLHLILSDEFVAHVGLGVC